MNVKSVRSDRIYAKMMTAPVDSKKEIYRYEMMMPFEKKWACFQVPMKASSPNGYDVIMASEMLGQLSPALVDETQKENIARLSDEKLWKACDNAVSGALDRFTKAGITLPVQDYLYTILLANPESPYIKLSNGYSGDGGIPGYICSWLTPNDNTIRNLPAAIAHETNHNIHFQFTRWTSNITLGDMIVSEGLAEVFATTMFGEEYAGPWVTKTTSAMLKEIKPILKNGLSEQGLENLNAYLYGDKIAKLQNFPPVGLPYCAGYACGYHLIQYYLQKTGDTIENATIIPAQEILDAVPEFWER